MSVVGRLGHWADAWDEGRELLLWAWLLSPLAPPQRRVLYGRKYPLYMKKIYCKMRQTSCIGAEYEITEISERLSYQSVDSVLCKVYIFFFTNLSVSSAIYLAYFRGILKLETLIRSRGREMVQNIAHRSRE